MNASDFLSDRAAAEAYLRKRAIDAAKLRAEMVWRFITPHVLRCAIYGHSLRIELVPGTLHAYPVACEFMSLGAYEPECPDSIDQVIAYILAKNW